jgi:hypothetical protein
VKLRIDARLDRRRGSQASSLPHPWSRPGASVASLNPTPAFSSVVESSVPADRGISAAAIS